MIVSCAVILFILSLILFTLSIPLFKVSSIFFTLFNPLSRGLTNLLPPFNSSGLIL